jgi:hypothetical protein
MRPNVMDGGSMAGGGDSAVQRFAGARLGTLGAMSGWIGAEMDSAWQGKANNRANEKAREAAQHRPRGYVSGSGMAPTAQSGPDYGRIGQEIAGGIRGLFAGQGRPSSGSTFSGGSGVGIGGAFGSGFNAERATSLGWSMPGSIFS